MRRSHSALVAALLLSSSLAVFPSQAKQMSYVREYITGGTPVLAFRFHPGQTNPAEEANPAEQDPSGTIEGSPADQTPLGGTPLDDRPLAGSPADVNIGGVEFEAGTYEGVPFKIIVEDETGFPVPWSACQLNGEVDVCGFNGEDVQQSDCGTEPGGTHLAGFQPDGDIGVWIMVTDSGGTWTGQQCDGPTSVGTVTLITKT